MRGRDSSQDGRGADGPEAGAFNYRLCFSLVTFVHLRFEFGARAIFEFWRRAVGGGCVFDRLARGGFVREPLDNARSRRNQRDGSGG